MVSRSQAQSKNVCINYNPPKFIMNTKVIMTLIVFQRDNQGTCWEYQKALERKYKDICGRARAHKARTFIGETASRLFFCVLSSRALTAGLAGNMMARANRVQLDSLHAGEWVRVGYAAR